MQNKNMPMGPFLFSLAKNHSLNMPCHTIYTAQNKIPSITTILVITFGFWLNRYARLKV
jgi:hypothetical protein